MNPSERQAAPRGRDAARTPACRTCVCQVGVTGRALRRRQRGVGLFVAVFMIAVLAVVGASFALISTSQQISSARALTLTRAYYAARAGIDQAVAEARSGDCSSVTATKTVDGVDVNLDCSQVTVRERNDTYLVFTITATAVTGSKDAGTLVRRRLEVQATSL